MNYKLLLLFSVIILCPRISLANYYTLPINASTTYFFDHNSVVGMEKYFDGDEGTVYEYDNHHGVDIVADYGTAVKPVAPGTVRTSGWENYLDEEQGYGFRVYLYHDISQQRTLYGHMASTSAVSVGAIVLRSDTIGYSSSTGTSTGPHLHFGVYDCDCTTPSSEQLDPYGWWATTTDPWPYNESKFLWTTNPPSLNLKTVLTGSISSDQTWRGNYYINSDVTINSGVTVTATPGTVVKFGTTGKLTINGTLISEGKETQPVYFTSYNDDDAGGDTNDNGTSTLAARGDWQGIVLNTGGVASFTYTECRYADTCVANNGGELTTDASSTVSYSYIGIEQTSGTSTVASTTLDNNTQALSVSGPGSVTLFGSTFTNNNAIGSIIYNAVLKVNMFANYIGYGQGTTTVNVSGTIGDVTWGSGIPILLTSSATVYASSTLTLLPGAVVKFKNTDTRLTVNGTLDAQGTADEQIYFTSYKDDTVGGDDNGDLIEVNPMLGDWSSIIIDDEGEATLDHTVIRYGGNAIYSPSMFYNGGTTYILSSELASSSDPAFYQNDGTASTTIASSTIHHVNYGILANNGKLTVTDTTFHHNPSGAASLSYSTGLQFISVGNTAISSTGSVAGYIANNSFTNDQVWSKGVPYFPNGNITIPATKTLTIEPGTVIKFMTTSSNLYVTGTLDALGTEEEPIYFTSYKDNDEATGGDTNGDGTTTSPARGNWGSVAVNSGGVATLEQVVNRYGGTNGNFFNNGGMLTLSKALITDGTKGVYTASGITDISSSTITNIYSRGVDRYSTGSLNVSYTNIFDNTSYGAYSAASTVLMAENNYWGDASGPYHPTTNATGTGDTVSNYVDYRPWLTSEVSW